MDTLTQRTALHIKQELYFLLDTANETAKKTQYFKQLAVAERLEKHYLLHCVSALFVFMHFRFIWN